MSETVFPSLFLLVSLQVFQTTVNQIYVQQFENAGEQLFLRIVTVCCLILLAVIAVIVGVIFIQQAMRKIPIQYAKRMLRT